MANQKPGIFRNYGFTSTRETTFMKVNKKYNQFTYNGLKDIIVNHKKYTDFNTLGLYRGIVENEKLDTEQKIEMRDFANEYFGKTFIFFTSQRPLDLL